MIRHDVTHQKFNPNNLSVSLQIANLNVLANCKDMIYKYQVMFGSCIISSAPVFLRNKNDFILGLAWFLQQTKASRETETITGHIELNTYKFLFWSQTTQLASTLNISNCFETFCFMVLLDFQLGICYSLTAF